MTEKRRRMRTQIAVEDVRKINGFMALTPAEGGWRVAIVDGAEELNQPRANALLKILEEPPQRAVLLLVCAAPGRLPPPSAAAAAACACRLLPDEPMDRAAGRSTCRSWAPTNAAGWSPWPKAPPAAPCCWREEEGLKIAALVDEVLADLPDLPPTRAHARGRRARPQRDRLLHLHGPAARRHRRGGARRSARPGRPGADRGWSRCARLMPGARCGTG